MQVPEIKTYKPFWFVKVIGRQYSCSEFDCGTCQVYGTELCDLFSQRWLLFEKGRASFLINDSGKILYSSELAVNCEMKAYVEHSLTVFQ
ncbi:hypothetical protein COX97_03090 [Candidatus Pacearchaeota archaeon CG_4_10_14_0_2_um_filter_05_32_18]|nr:MAG: hypothetical protein COX97_03090 [Candidatus Pacearchaeota archaeon CG_4_10_14_0_2_um_filter_05_32_18]